MTAAAVPTRVSVREGDPGYRPGSHLYVVYCDGERLQRCHTADAELGIAWCYVVGDNGRIARDPVHLDLPLERVVRGRIEIRLRGGETGKSCRAGGGGGRKSTAGAFRDHAG